MNIGVVTDELRDKYVPTVALDLAMTDWIKLIYMVSLGVDLCRGVFGDELSVVAGEMGLGYSRSIRQ